MSVKEFGFGTIKLASLAIVKMLWSHAPEIIQFCMMIYAIGLAVQTLYHLRQWIRRKIAAYRARPAA